jgi:hypothetical protein
MATSHVRELPKGALNDSIFIVIPALADDGNSDPQGTNRSLRGPGTDVEVLLQ